MTSAIDLYLAQVARKLAGMDRRVRDDILRELRSHLADAVADGGEEVALRSLEPPQAVAARFKDLYGYGRAYQALFVAGAATLAVFTVPLLLLAGAALPVSTFAAVALLLVLVVYLLAVAVRAGSAVGAVAGVAACLSRLASVAVLGATVGAVVLQATDLLVFVLVSVLLIPVGFLPGRARERWRRREVVL